MTRKALSISPISLFLLSISLFFFTACDVQKQRAQTPSDDGKIDIALVQINDVYEISGVSGGRRGNLARVASFYKKVKRDYPQSAMVIAGDFLNPSLINTLEYQGERISGRSMVEVLNAAGLDLAAIGNHEFDLDYPDLQKRINESKFDWLASNMTLTCGELETPFFKNTPEGAELLPATSVQKFIDADGTEASLGWFSATINSNPRDYVKYGDVDSSVNAALKKLEGISDYQIGLTHLSIDGDKHLAKNFSDIELILGGHEHHNMKHEVNGIRICKADANAKTLYLHILHIDKNTNTLSIESSLIDMDEKMEKDPKTQRVIQKWNKILEENVSKIIDKPYAVIYHAEEPLDARESTIRFRQCNMGEAVANAMINASGSEEVQAAMLNSGSIRMDDQIGGDVTGIDIFRLLPFGGKVYNVEIRGNLLKKVLDFGSKTDIGSYLQYSGFSQSDGKWMIGDSPITDGETYHVAMNDFLLMGYDIPFLKEDHADIIKIDKPEDESDLRYDIRKAIIEYLKMQ